MTLISITIPLYYYMIIAAKVICNQAQYLFAIIPREYNINIQESNINGEKSSWEGRL